MAAFSDLARKVLEESIIHAYAVSDHAALDTFLTAYQMQDMCERTLTEQDLNQMFDTLEQNRLKDDSYRFCLWMVCRWLKLWDAPVKPVSVNIRISAHDDYILQEAWNER